MEQTLGITSQRKSASISTRLLILVTAKKAQRVAFSLTRSHLKSSLQMHTHLELGSTDQFMYLTRKERKSMGYLATNDDGVSAVLFDAKACN